MPEEFQVLKRDPFRANPEQDPIASVWIGDEVPEETKREIREALLGVASLTLAASGVHRRISATRTVETDFDALEFENSEDV